MTERAGFVAAIAADPDDFVSRLSYSDWLREHGEEIAADELRACGRARVLELLDGYSERERTFLVEVGGCKDVIAFMAVAHSLGVPRPGDTHPIYGTVCDAISAQLCTRGMARLTCTYS